MIIIYASRANNEISFYIVITLKIALDQCSVGMYRETDMFGSLLL